MESYNLNSLIPMGSAFLARLADLADLSLPCFYLGLNGSLTGSLTVCLKVDLAICEAEFRARNIDIKFFR